MTCRGAGGFGAVNRVSSLTATLENLEGLREISISSSRNPHGARRCSPLPNFIELVAINFISMTPMSLIFNSFFQRRRGVIRSAHAVFRDETEDAFSCRARHGCSPAMGSIEGRAAGRATRHLFRPARRVRASSYSSESLDGADDHWRSAHRIGATEGCTSPAAGIARP